VEKFSGRADGKIPKNSTVKPFPGRGRQQKNEQKWQKNDQKIAKKTEK